MTAAARSLHLKLNQLDKLEYITFWQKLTSLVLQIGMFAMGVTVAAVYKWHHLFAAHVTAFDQRQLHQQHKIMKLFTAILSTLGFWTKCNAVQCPHTYGNSRISEICKHSKLCKYPNIRCRNNKNTFIYNSISKIYI